MNWMNRYSAMTSVPMNSRIRAALVSYSPRPLMSWKVATWLVTLGMRVATRNSTITSVLPRKVNRSRAYAAIVPISTVPTSDTTRTIVVLMKPSSILPLVNAVTKLSKFEPARWRGERPGRRRTPAAS